MTTEVLSSQALVEARCPSCGKTLMVTQGYNQDGDFVREQGMCPRSSLHRKDVPMRPYGSVQVQAARHIRRLT